MSFIYEALKRAEDENARGAVTSGAVRRPPFFATRPRAWLWALIGILAANAAVLVTLFLVRGSHPPGVTLTTRTEPVASPAVSPPPGADAADVTSSKPPAVIPASPAIPAAPAATPPPTTSLAPLPPAARAAPSAGSSAGAAARPGRPAVAHTKPLVPPPARTGAPRVDSAPASTPAAVAPDVVSARPAAPAPIAPPASAVAPPAPAPGAESPPPPAIDTSKLHIQVVVYSDVPAERMVIIDGRRYAEGQKLDAETVVERITPNGAVVSRQGQRVTLTSGRP